MRGCNSTAATTARNWAPLREALGPDAGPLEPCIVYFPKRDRSLAIRDDQRRNVDIYDFFLPKIGHWWWAQASDLLDQLSQGAALPRLDLSESQWRNAAAVLSAGSSDGVTFLAAQLGSPGPYQKVTLLGTSDCGDLRVTKLSLKPTADIKVRSELESLKKISGCESTAPFAPELLASGITTSDRPYFTMRGIIGSPPSRHLTQRLLSLLERLNTTTSAGWEDWRSTRLRHDLHKSVSDLSSRALPAYQMIVRSSEIVDDLLSVGSIHPCLSHGDFAPWNIIETENGPVLLDWEYASFDGNPIADYCHFRLIQQVLNHRSPRAANRLLHRLSASAPIDFPHLFERTPDLQGTASGLVLLYLLETVCLYLTSTPTSDGTDRVTGSYLALMADFQNWRTS
ncbi:MAG TPA: phosphotransferase [Rhodocyclaceae bacterium]|nr:phosphotransferase [Rhodocyclaceae bacterium]